MPPDDNSVSRRSLLRAAGIGAGVAATSGVVTAAPASARVARPAAADLPLIGGPEFPIGLFWPPPPLQTTLDRYQEIAAADFDFIITGNYLFDQYIDKYALGLAQQAGLQVLIASAEPRLTAATHTFDITDGSAPLTISRDEATTLFQQALNDYTPYSSFAGISVYDEPHESKLQTVGIATDILRQLASTHLPYSNIVPGQGDSYSAFAQEYVDTVKPSLLSFDRYPFLTAGLDLNYFDNWARIRAIGLAAGIPTWTYIQSVQFNNHPYPTAAQVLWQINISLAYGGKGIQYFTYWQPDPARGEGYGPALLTVTGERAPLYAAARTINSTWLHPAGRELKPLVSESVQHANDDPLPPGTTAFAPGDYLTSVTGGALVLGLFRADPDTGQRWLLAVNRSPDAAASARIGTKAQKVEQFDPRTGGYANLGNPKSIAFSAKAGAATLYRLTV
ncbi:MAG TPA: hypothetical protein VHC49_22375 [Mycobacteriales bacterium]|nr:hypothetical protein [Mycobacteriales bacterium]